VTIFVLFGWQLPQKILFSETRTERNPGPGSLGVGVKNGVAVNFPIIIGIGMPVDVGWNGSNVGICTIVGEGVMVGVTVAVGVFVGADVIVTVAVEAGTLVGNNPGMPMQDWIKIANTTTR
jgi:hypothetical protein